MLFIFDKRVLVKIDTGISHGREKKSADMIESGKLVPALPKLDKGIRSNIFCIGGGW
jgi:hypothetical protein